MNDKPKIIVGLVVVLVVLTFPFWYTLSAGRPDPPAKWEFPGEKCVEDDIRANHMGLLNQWRDAVVRDGKKTDDSKNLGEVEMSLTGKCLACHARLQQEASPVKAGEALSTRDAFCRECHKYADVQPTCWACHVDQ